MLVTCSGWHWRSHWSWGHQVGSRGGRLWTRNPNNRRWGTDCSSRGHHTGDRYATATTNTGHCHRPGLWHNRLKTRREIAAISARSNARLWHNRGVPGDLSPGGSKVVRTRLPLDHPRFHRAGVCPCTSRCCRISRLSLSGVWEVPTTITLILGQ